MNSHYWEGRYREHDTGWDKGRAHPELVRWLSVQDILGRVLVPGCGTGHDVRAVATRADEVVGLDFAPSAIATAESFSRVAAERYVTGDFFQSESNWAREGFDWIIEHTLFCAIPIEKRAEYFEVCYRLLHPGGKMFAIFFLNPEVPLENGPPFGVSWNTLQKLFSKQFVVLETWLPKETFPDRPRGEQVAILQKKTL